MERYDEFSAELASIEEHGSNDTPLTDGEVSIAVAHEAFMRSWIWSQSEPDNLSGNHSKYWLDMLINCFVEKLHAKLRRIVHLSLDLYKIILPQNLENRNTIIAEMTTMMEHYKTFVSNRKLAWVECSQRFLPTEITMRRVCFHLLFGQQAATSVSFFGWTQTSDENILEETIQLPLVYTGENMIGFSIRFHTLATFTTPFEKIEMTTTKTIACNRIANYFENTQSEIMSFLMISYRLIFDENPTRMMYKILTTPDLSLNYSLADIEFDAELIATLSNKRRKSIIFYYSAVFSIFTNACSNRALTSLEDWTALMTTYNLRKKTEKFKHELVKLPQMILFEYGETLYTLKDLFLCSNYLRMAEYYTYFDSERIDTIRNPVLKEYLWIQLIKIHAYYVHMKPMLEVMSGDCVREIISYCDPKILLINYLYEYNTTWIARFEKLNFKIFQKPIKKLFG